MDEEMKRLLPMKDPRRWRGCIITVLFAVMTILFLILLILVPALYIQLSDEYNEQVMDHVRTYKHIRYSVFVWYSLVWCGVLNGIKSQCHDDLPMGRQEEIWWGWWCHGNQWYWCSIPCSSMLHVMWAHMHYVIDKSVCVHVWANTSMCAHLQVATQRTTVHSVTCIHVYRARN